MAAVRLGCARSQRHFCRARLRLHARGGRSAARPVSIRCGHPNQRRDDVRTHHLGMRGALTIWAAHRVCRMVRTHPPAWRGRGARRLDARALDHWTHAPLAPLLLVATAGLRTTRTCAPCAALVSAESVARRACLRSAARSARTRCSVGLRKVRAHVAPPAARQLSSAVHLSTVGGLGCAATRPESVERAAAARTRSAQLAASPGQRRSSRRHPNSPE